MSNIRDTATVTLNINGAQAKKVLKDMEAEYAKNTQKIKQMEAAHADPKSIERWKRKNAELKRQMEEMRSAMSGVTDTLRNLDKATPKQLEKTLRTLKSQLKSLQPGTKVWDEHCAKIRKVEAQMRLLNEQTRQQRSFLSRLNEGFNNCAASIMAFVAGLTGVVAAGRSCVSAFADMDESMTNTRKFTGMSIDDVEKLNDAFDKMGTRTEKIKLNDLAQEAGRLGKNTLESVQGYVEAADIINVALSDLGQGATQEIAKLTNIFGVEEKYGTKEAMLKTASTINVLSQNCVASKPYLVEFAKRMAGIGAQAKMTVPEIIAFGAVLDSNGQKCEMSSSAISRLVMMLYQKPRELFSKVGLDVEKSIKILNGSATEGVLMFLSQLDKLGGDAQKMAVLAPLFDELGMDGIRMSQVLATMSGNIDQVRTQMENANKAFREGTSATHEFDLFNNTTQAGLDKAKKRIMLLRVELGKELLPVMKHILSSSTAIVKGLKIAVGFFKEYWRVIVLVTTAIVAYNIAVNRAVIVTKLKAAWTAIATTAEKALHGATILAAAAQALFAGNTARATAAMRLFNSVTKINPLGALVAAISAVVGALVLFKSKTEEVTQAQKELRSVENQAQLNAGQELYNLKMLYEATQDVTLSMSERLRAAKELQNSYPDTFWFFSREEILLGKAKKAYDELTSSIIKSARAEAYRNKLSSLQEEKLDLETKYPWFVDETMAKTWEMVPQDPDYLIDKVIPTPDWMNPSSRGEAKKQWEDWNRLNEINGLIDEIGQKYQDLVIGDADKGRLPNPMPEDPNLDRKVNTDPSLEYDIMSVAKAIAEKPGSKNEAPSIPSPSPKGSGGSGENPLKKKFEDSLKELKEKYAQNEADLLFIYNTGIISYRGYLEAKDRLDEKYISERKALYGSLAESDSKYAKDLAKEKRSEFTSLYKEEVEFSSRRKEEKAAKKVESLKKEYEEKVSELEISYMNPNSELFHDKEAKEKALYELKISYLTKYRDAYALFSKEWVKYDEEIQKAEREWNFQQEKSFLEKVSAWKEAYTKESLEKRLQIELGILEKAHEKGLISEEEYQKKKAKIAKTKIAMPEKKKEKSESVSSTWGKESKSDKQSEAEDARLKAIDELNKKLDEGKITADEYDEELDKIYKSEKKTVVGSWMSNMDGQMKEIIAFGALCIDVFARIKESGKISFEDIADIASYSFAIIGGALEQFVEFSSAQSKIDIANTEKAYDKKIERAKGNSYLEKKLEEEKAEKVAELKAKQTKKEFNIKVIQTVAQTLINAVEAYGVGLQAGFPMALWLAPALAGLATAMGGVQVALLKKQQQAAEAVGYASGGFTPEGGVYEPAGIVHKGEWVASQKLLKNPVIRPMIYALDAMQQGKTVGQISGVSTVSRGIVSQAERSSADESTMYVLSAVMNKLGESVSSLDNRLKEPIVATSVVSGDRGVSKSLEYYDRLRYNAKRK